MLVLSRKVHQRIAIGDDITVTICAINGTIVRVGIDAPQDVPIVRSEPEPEELAEMQKRRRDQLRKRSRLTS